MYEDDPNFSLGNILKLETSAVLCDNLGFRNYFNYSTVGNRLQQMDCTCCEVIIIIIINFINKALFKTVILI